MRDMTRGFTIGDVYEPSSVGDNRAYGWEEIREYIIQYHAIYIILPKRNTKKHGLWIGIFISNDIWLNVFFINLNSFVVLLLNMIS